MKIITKILAEKIDKTSTAKPMNDAKNIKKNKKGKPIKWTYEIINNTAIGDATMPTNEQIIKDSLAILIYELEGEFFDDKYVHSKHYQELYQRDLSWYVGEGFYDKNFNFIMYRNDKSFILDGVKYSIEGINKEIDEKEFKRKEMITKISFAIYSLNSFSKIEKEKIINYLEDHLVK